MSAIAKAIGPLVNIALLLLFAIIIFAIIGLEFYSGALNATCYDLSDLGTVESRWYTTYLLPNHQLWHAKCQSSVGTCTHCIHVFAHLAPTRMLSRCLLKEFLRRSSEGSLLRVCCWLGRCNKFPNSIACLLRFHCANILRCSSPVGSTPTNEKKINTLAFCNRDFIISISGIGRNFCFLACKKNLPANRLIINLWGLDCQGAF